MSIQSTINQGISLAGLLMSQSPMAEKARVRARDEAETERLRGNVGKASAATEEILTELTTERKNVPETEIAATEDLYLESLEREAAAEESLFYHSPTTAGARQLVLSRSAIADQRQATTDDRDARAREAAEKARAREQARMDETRRFTDVVIDPKLVWRT